MDNEKSILDKITDTVKGIATIATDAASHALKSEEPPLKADESAIAYMPLAADGLVSDPLIVVPPARKKRAARKASTKTVKKAVKKASKKTAKKAAKKSAKKAAQKSTAKKSKTAAKKTASKTVKKAGKKTAKKAVKKAVRKKRRA